MASRRRTTCANIFGLGKPAPKRRTTRRTPTVSRRVGGFLWREVTGQRKREQAAAREREAKAAAKVAAKERHEQRLRELRETKEMRAAAVLWHRAEAEKAKAELYRARAEAARSAETRRSNGSKAATAERRNDEFEDLARKAEAGQLTGDQLRYFINTYGQGGKKRK